MPTRRVRTSAGYVTDPGGGPDQWQTRHTRGSVVSRYVTDPGGGPDQWQVSAIPRTVVRDKAGLPSGVTPGYTGSPGTTGVARTSRSGGANSVWTITRMADIAAIASNPLAAGTETDPFIIQNFDLFGYSNAAGDTRPVIDWNHDAGTYPSEVYWIKVVNCAFGVGGGNANRSGDAYVNAPTGGGIIFENCTFASGLSYENGFAGHVTAVRGTARFRYCRLIQASGAFVHKTGANAIVECFDHLFDTSQGSWGNGVAMFWNATAGGSFWLKRVTVDHRANNDLFRPQRDCTLRMDLVDFNSTDNATPQYVILTQNPYLAEPWASGGRITRSRFRAGATALIGWTVVDDNQDISNLHVANCEFTATAPRLSTARLIAVGDGNKGSASVTNSTWRWCRFKKSQTDGVLAGAEAFEMWNPSNVLVEACWIDSCGEDAYEFVYARDNVVIQYCGGGDISGSKVGGNMVDFYGGGGAHAGSTNCAARFVWGACGGDAVIVDSCTNVAVSGIDIDNAAGGFVQNPPASNIRLHSRAANSLNGVTVAQPVSTAAKSFNSKPCELTYEASTHNAGTVVWPEWNGSSFDTRGGNDGIVDGM